MSSVSLPPKSGFLAGPWLDGLFLIGAPLVAVLAFVPVWLTPWLGMRLGDTVVPWAPTMGSSLLLAFINAHLAAVFFRSHANSQILWLHPWRFLAVPMALVAGMWVSDWLFALGLVLGVWWDVYHSSMQTFGIGRIYDMKAGNDPTAGRQLDRGLNLLLYVGPIVGGTSLALHLQSTHEALRDQAGINAALFERSPVAQPYLAVAMLAIGLPFLAYYIYGYWRLSQQGYRVSYQKVALYVILAGVSLGCWGFNSFGEAFFVMNFFHALQYFFIVWHMERRNIMSLFRLSSLRWGEVIALSLFVFFPFAFGAISVLDMRWMPPVLYRGYLCLLLTVSLLHYWYDGFIWSVRKKQVA